MLYKKNTMITTLKLNLTNIKMTIQKVRISNKRYHNNYPKILVSNESVRLAKYHLSMKIVQAIVTNSKTK